MTVRWVCPHCGTGVLRADVDPGARLACRACNRSFVPAAAPPRPAPDDDVDDPERYVLPAAEGLDAVPPPRPSGAGVDAQLALTLAWISLPLPPVGPLALWLVTREVAALRAGDAEIPRALRTARLVAVVGTCLLALLCVGAAPLLLIP